VSDGGGRDGDPMRVLIVDDEALARRGIRARLSRRADVQVVGECENGRAALEAIEQLHPDLVFLDVQMPGLDGLDTIARTDPGKMPMVIFVTAHEQYALRAFDASAIDYLLKPIDDERLERGLNRALTRRRERSRGEWAASLAKLVSAAPRTERDAQRKERSAANRLALRDRGRITLVDPMEIVWIAADGDYVTVHTRDRRYSLRDTMQAMAERLGTAHFLRIHRSAIVNLSQIRELEPLANGELIVTLHTGARLRASRSYVSELLRRLDT